MQKAAAQLESLRRRLAASELLDEFTLRRGEAGAVVVDVADEALQKGKAKLEKKVGKGVETGAFTAEQQQRMVSSVTFTSDYDQLKGADLVVESVHPGIGRGHLEICHHQEKSRQLERAAEPGHHATSGAVDARLINPGSKRLRISRPSAP